MKIAFHTIVFILALMCISTSDSEQRSWLDAVFVGEAEAIIGLPFTPLSFAGVARRTTRRMWYASAAAAAAPAPYVAAAPAPPPAAPTARTGVPIGTVTKALPGGCKTVAVSGQSYSDCGGVFYKAAFQGNNLVYVVVKNPL